MSWLFERSDARPPEQSGAMAIPAGGAARAAAPPAAGAPLLDFRYLFSVARRRLWIVALIAPPIAALGLLVASVLPPVYQATASILVESQQIPTELVQSTVSTPAAEQIEVIRQRLLTRDTLLALAERHRIFAGLPTQPTPTERLAEMRSRIEFRQVALGAGRRGDDTTAIIFTIGFSADQPGPAAAVVNDLVTQVLQQNVEIRRAQAEVTSTFFEQELTRLSSELTRTEAEIAAFQNRNQSALPDSVDYRRTRLIALQEQIQRLELERIDLRQEQSALEDAAAATPPTAELSAIAQELESLRRTLLRRQVLLRPDHPEIRWLETEIAGLEAVVAAQGEDADPAAETRPDLYALEIGGRLERVEARLDFIASTIERLEEERLALEASLGETPRVQLELAALDRRYEDLKLRYQSARQKLSQAETGELLEDKQQGQRLEVIEQAVPPEEPVSPNRTKLAVMGIGAGLAAGLGLAAALEFLSSVVRRPSDLAKIGREVVAVIPEIVTTRQRRLRWAGRVAAVLLVVGGGAGAAFAVHTYYLPLETVGEKLLEKAELDDYVALARARFGF